MRTIWRLVVGLVAILAVLSDAPKSGAWPGSDPADPTAAVSSAQLEPPYSPVIRAMAPATDRARSTRAPASAVGIQSTAAVIGPDDRIRVSPTTGAPARSIALVDVFWPDGTETTCTGTFIGPDAVLTAAHCLHDPTTSRWPVQIDVVPGLDVESAPFGWDSAANASVPRGWTDGVDRSEMDWGLVTMPSREVGNRAGWLSIGVLSDAELAAPGFTPTIAGYPGDKPFGTQWTASEPGFYEITPSILSYRVDVYYGESGAAVRRGRDNLVVGVLSRGIDYENEGGRITPVVASFLVDSCESLGCHVSVVQHRVYLPLVVRP